MLWFRKEEVSEQNNNLSRIFEWKVDYQKNTLVRRWNWVLKMSFRKEKLVKKWFCTIFW